jgi:hypothetical protein
VGSLTAAVVDKLATAEPTGWHKVEEADHHVEDGAEVVPWQAVAVEAQRFVNTVVNLAVCHLYTTHRGPAKQKYDEPDVENEDKVSV